MNSKKLTKAFAASAFLLASTAAFAEHGTVYISPNNDGVQDTLEVPLKIKEKRYVKEWSFLIFDKDDNVVRTIGNKISLPAKLTFKSFWKSLRTTKKGVEVPSSIVWNGFLDDGSVAEDGTYYYQFTAADDNGNTATTSKFKVIVDNTAPEINLANLVGNDKTFGEGAKATLKIGQSGSVEKLWTAKITDTAGQIIRSYKWEEASPVDVIWNGTDEKKGIVPDGVYNYEITSTDLAGNISEKAVISNIIFSAEKPEVAISINGSRYFAPHPAGRKTESQSATMNFDVAIPAPTASVNSLTDWTISIIDSKDETVWSKTGKTNPPSKLAYDGKKFDMTSLPEGEYRAKVTAKYLNGYEPVPSYSPVFVLDNTPPKAGVKLPQNKVFNGQQNFTISQSFVAEPPYTGEKNWVGKIVDSNSNEVRTFDFGNVLPETVSWNGLDDSGKFASDGDYKYVIEVEEAAGNVASYESAETFRLDTSKTELALSANVGAFAPAGNSSQKTVTLTPSVKAANGISSYEIGIYTGSILVKKYEGSSVPASVTWDGIKDDGTRCEEGTYFATIKTVAVSGTKADAKSQEFVLDNTPPAISISADYTVFSPDGTSSKQTLPVKVSDSSVEAKWTAEIRNSSNAVVKSVSWSNAKASAYSWDGTDNSGNKVANGIYSIEYFAKDDAGNTGSAKITGISLDTRPATAFVTAEHPGISPNGDNYLDSQKFNVKVSLAEGISSWKFEVLNASGSAVKTFSSKDSAALPASINWAGDTNSGSTAEGTFSGKLVIEYAKGNVVEAVSSSFICTPNAPSLTVKTLPQYFSPDNDGDADELFIQLKCQTIANLKNWSYTIKDRNGKQFWKISGKTSINEKIRWDGRGNNGELVQSAEDYPYTFTVTDDLGMTSTVEGVINVDILVVRDGNKLKMQIPSIIFRSDAADFNIRELDANGNVKKAGITKAQAENNERVLKRVAEVLKKFGDYKVTVVGHANRTSDNPKEEEVDGTWGRALGPLSKERAQYVKDQLVKKGISAGRLSVEGKGGSEPVPGVDRKDKDVNWKNRRVEFILEK